jgi:glycosyltransferase involved in cell wall biosynthesis
MSLRILSIAFTFAPVGPCAVGGAEEILSELDEALESAGDHSVVVACEGSKIKGQLFCTPLPQQGILDDSARQWCRFQFQSSIDRALASSPFDLIHMHGFDFHQYSLPPRIPVLVTLHMPIPWYPADAWTNSGMFQFQCVSETQRQACPEHMQGIPVIPNGVRIEPVPLQLPRESFALVLGRICPEKNLHAALDAGTLAHTPVLIGGKVFPYHEHRMYFQRELLPRLQGHAGATHRFLGPLDPLQRAELLKRAKCLLHPTLAPETSSLVAMEALAAGTPVIAYRSGAMPEIVEHGVTGFLVDDVQEMAEAIADVHRISPDICRTTAARRFSRGRMIREYFQLYDKMLSQNKKEPVYA